MAVVAPGLSFSWTGDTDTWNISFMARWLIAYNCIKPVTNTSLLRNYISSQLTFSDKIYQCDMLRFKPIWLAVHSQSLILNIGMISTVITNCIHDKRIIIVERGRNRALHGITIFLNIFKKHCFPIQLFYSD